MRTALVAVLMTLALFTCALGAQADAERRKIEFLLATVENLKGAQFIRNGTPYDGKQAAEHLRMKLDRAGSRVRTAEDFIDLCASRSYTSGKPYMIRFPDGRTVPAGDFLRERLREYHAGGK